MYILDCGKARPASSINLETQDENHYLHFPSAPLSFLSSSVTLSFSCFLPILPLSPSLHHLSISLSCLRLMLCHSLPLYLAWLHFKAGWLWKDVISGLKQHIALTAITEVVLRCRCDIHFSGLSMHTHLHFFMHLKSLRLDKVLICFMIWCKCDVISVPDCNTRDYSWQEMIPWTAIFETQYADIDFTIQNIGL